MFNTTVEYRFNERLNFFCAESYNVDLKKEGRDMLTC